MLTLKRFEIRSKYGVVSASEMDAKYKHGELEEENSWRDFFRLTHLEEQSATFEKLLKEVSVE